MTTRPLSAALLLLCLAAAPAAAAEVSHDIVAWGDSLTAGFGADIKGGYVAAAAKYFAGKRDVVNLASVNATNTSGTSTNIAYRLNAFPVSFMLEGEVIPAKGPADSTEKTGFKDFGGGSLNGTLCGARGNLSTQGDLDTTWLRFVRRGGSGDVVPCPAGSSFIFDDGVAYKNRVAWLWLGSNGASDGHTVEGDIAASVAALGHDHYLVGAVLNDPATPADDAKAINAALKTTYGDHFVDIVALLAAASDGSDRDKADVAAGQIPHSLRSLGMHLNQKGYDLVAGAFEAATEKLGY